ncbi:membrane-bound lytic murein transglycosylase A [Rhodobium orientis]|uniref:murein transglycosylase A n=1 Tax=Rhodobium orientis TaxID=34017 RepID=UPI0017FD4046|nr:MltA domain-containing protein [Rhodobium orientis]MBB4304296.1 membrane-bound lytic murein transglycosylase A [Rhodobium orientis]
MSAIVAAPSDLGFDDLPGWAEDDHLAALETFRLSCGPNANPPETGSLKIDAAAIRALCVKAQGLEIEDAIAAKRFFETHFVPVRIADPGAAFFTGYFEPEVPGSRERTERFSTPLLKRPDDLVKLTPEIHPETLDPALEWARRTKNGLVEHPDRAAIMDGALDGRGLELVWVEDPVDAFFVHVQGSARIRLSDGSAMRVGFAGKTGHPYSSVARMLVEAGEFAPEDLTADVLKAWLKAHPERARRLIAKNRSFIFFRELTGLDPDLGPVGAAGVQLTAGRSIAVDRRFHTLGTPVYVAVDLPQESGEQPMPYRRLMVAEDTGSAIVGAARGDLFIGSGEAAGLFAGRIRHRGDFFVLVPRTGAVSDGQR